MREAAVPSNSLSAEEQALARREQPLRQPRRYKSLRRFEYWQTSSVNPWADDAGGDRLERDPLEIERVGHAHLERECGDAHGNGDPEAILRYARADAWCFRSAWFVEQLEAWRDAGEDAKLRQVMAAFARNSSKVSNKKLRDEIVRDQHIFRDVVTRPAGQSLNRCFGDLANKFSVSEDTVRDVHEHYRPFLDQQIAAGIPLDVFFERLGEMVTRLP